ncbi:galactose oxidase [Clathrospora elynae]|uniref:Galactose oxidase n=1 Tax=Clathrospora elynae TaxID=706981 RepID=A0A6A5SEG2_9PLEO|nr:galactose oxidase [Clathrospora elynae]
MAYRTSISVYLFHALLFTTFANSASVAISRSGWTATADSFQSGNEPAKALYANAASFWHSQYSPTPVGPLSHWIVVDMRAVYNINAISIQLRPSDSANGRIGGHRIEVSTDNSTWQITAVGKYNNDATTKKTVFVTRPARFVRITATSEAQGANNQWTAIAEVNISQETSAYAPPAPGKGSWEKTVEFPLIPAAVSLLTDRKVLMWSAFAKDNFGGQKGFTQTGIYDPGTAESSQLNVSNTQHDMFCPGILLDFNGNVVVTGGSNVAKTSIYDLSSDVWSGAANMKIARGYQASATCSDGRIFTIGGEWSGGSGDKNGEIYNPTTNTCTTGAGIRLDDGHAMNGNAVMYDAPAGKILTAGGAPDYEDSDARTNAYIITIDAPKTNPTVTKTQNMAYARGFAFGVALPDGTVLVLDEQAHVKPFRDDTAVFVPEPSDPVTGTWTKLNPHVIPRNYHSVAILLSDATIFHGGGGLCGPCTQYGGVPESNHLDAEIFVPPYLLNSDRTRRMRPIISTVAASVRLGASLSVTTGGAVAKFSMRRIPLTMEGSGRSYTVSIPGDPGVALPGYWLLFAIDSNGTPSVGKFIKVTV